MTKKRTKEMQELLIGGAPEVEVNRQREQQGMTGQNANTKRMPWAEVFIELSLRALRRINHDYILWSIGPCRKGKERNHGHLNQGPGIELADERTVCAAITQEFIYSGLTSGNWFDADPEAGIKEGFRFWEVEREKEYPNGKGRVDLLVRRFNPNDEKETWGCSYIEAKRAQVWTTKLGGNKPSQKSYERQVKLIIKDIAKLRRNVTHSSTEGPYCHLLVWNVVENGDTKGTPEGFFREIRDNKVQIRQVRWAPLSWDPPTKESTMPVTTRSLWVCLAEVK